MRKRMIKPQENINTKELDFLYELSELLTKEQDFSYISNCLQKLFKTYFGIEQAYVFLKEELMILLKIFDVNQNNIKVAEKYRNIMEKYKNLQSNTFLINKEIIDPDFLNVNSYQKLIELIKPEKNSLYLPLIANNQIIGFIHLHFDKLNKETITKSFFVCLSIVARQLSSMIATLTLNYQMQTNIKFHSAMKNIAKIIENQYEFAYIVPLIGEMIDRFVPEHLIYVFIKQQNGEFELVWPSSCHDRNIYTLLKSINKKKNVILSENKKIGVFPLIGEKETLGAIVAYSNIEKLLENEINYIQELSKQASITIQKAEMYAEILKHAALDALTGLNNRRQFEVRLNQEIANAKRKGSNLCCIMLDVDYFKKINDTHGHVAGDCILKELAKLLIKELREYDIASRYGGEEFCILLPSTSLEEAGFVAQRLRKAVEGNNFDITEAKIQNLTSLKITISLGVAQYQKSMKNSFELYKKADEALYSAKKSGRNKVIICKD